MDIVQLEKGNELLKIIESTRQGLKGVEEVEDKIRDYKEKRYYDDKLYSLNIGVHSDFSGAGAELNRYNGNVELLLAIKNVLQNQLERFEDEFKTL